MRGGRVMKANTHAVCLALLGCLTCACSQPRTEGFARPVRSSCGSSAGEDYYFDAAFLRDNRRNVVLAKSYATLLAGIDEPSLACGDEVGEGYRLIEDPALDPQKRVIRAGRADNRLSLAGLVVATEAGSPRIVDRFEKSITAEQWERLRTAVRNVNLSFLPTLPLTSGPGTGFVMDATSWIVEGRWDSFYHVAVFGPVQEQTRPALKDMREVFFHLAGFEIPGNTVR